jgi:two-component system sensor histidine kinase DesK
VVTTSHWWSAKGGTETIDRAVRWPMYLLSGSVPGVLLLLTSGEPAVAAPSAAVLLAVAVAHTACCLALLRAGIGRSLGGPRPSPLLMASVPVLTLAGAVAVVGTFPDAGRGPGGLRFGIGAGSAVLLLCAAATAAFAPLLPARRLAAAVAVPAALMTLLPLVAGGSGRPVWGFNYLACVGGNALTYRVSVWLLNLLWQMHRTREVRAELAVAQERLRFARDLHDVLGRNLATMAVSSELAAELLRLGRDGAQEHLLTVRRTAHDSMRELREVVGGYRSADLAAELSGAGAVLRSAGISTRVIGSGEHLPASAQTTLGWVVREATTNVLRHSEATAVTIDLADVAGPDGEPAVVLRVDNDGVRPVDPTRGPGSGLVGLRERLADVGGDLSAESLPGNHFRLQARLPVLTPVVPATERRP